MAKETKENIENINSQKSVEEIKKNKNFVTALHHSIDGVIKAFKTERNLRIDYLIALVVMIAGVVLGLDKTEFVCLCLTIGFVLFSEMMNSVSEYIVDLITDKYDNRAKAAKDIAAGGVLISSGISVIVAYFLFADKLQNATSAFLSAAISSRGNIFMTILFAIVVTVVILKGWLGRGEEYAHTGPSLNVALAFGLTTYASLITRSFLVGAVCAVLSLMIFVLKVTNTKARKINMLFSAALGILIVLFVYQLVLFGPEIFKLFNF